MIQHKVGTTHLSVTEYSFGTAGIAGLYRPCSDQLAFDTMQAAWDAGIRYFDTAPHYGLGLAERRVGDFLRNVSDGTHVVSSKVGRLLTPVKDGENPRYGFVDPLPFDEIYDYSYDGIMRSHEFSLARMGVNRIDILFVHDIGKYTHGAERNAIYIRQLMDSGLKALSELKSSGAIAAYGLGVNEVPVCLDVLKDADLDCILMAGRYSLLDRSASAELLPLCRRKQVSLIVGGVFNSGILATGAVAGANFDYGPASDDVLARVSAMEKIAESHAIPLAAAAMQFPLREPLVASVLLGTAKPSSMIRNMQMSGYSIPASAYEAFDGHTLVAPELGDKPVRV
jgi:D-threo-aldose 1-dehydrogenase